MCTQHFHLAPDCNAKLLCYDKVKTDLEKAELQVNDLKTAAANVLNAGSLLGVGVIPPMLRQELIALDQVMKKHSTKGQCNKCGEEEAVMNGLCPECIRKQGFA